MKLNAIAAENESFKPPMMKIKPVVTANTTKMVEIIDSLKNTEFHRLGFHFYILTNATIAHSITAKLSVCSTARSDCHFSNRLNTLVSAASS